METDVRISVLHLISGLEMGGAERMLLWTARHFDRDSIDLVVVSLMSGGALASLIRAEGVRVLEMGQRRGRLSLMVIWRLIRLTRSLTPRIVQGHLFHSNILSRFLAPLVPGARSISTRHNETDTPFRALLYRVTDRLSAGTIVFSEPVRRHALKDSRVGGEVRLVPYGIDPERPARDREEVRKELGLDPDAWIWITVGRLTRQKGLDLLIEAFSEAGKRVSFPLFLLIVGPGEDRPILEAQAKRRTREGEVVFLGQRGDVADLLAASDAFVLSSRWEGGPLVVLEAMAAALPVVATRVGDVDRMVVDGVTGLVVDPGNVPELTEAMVRVVGLGAKARQWGAAGNRRVLTSYQFSRTQRQVENFYLEIALAPVI
jgi:glycosyltransferase involved in cell wall biosynthesis